MKTDDTDDLVVVTRVAEEKYRPEQEITTTHLQLQSFGKCVQITRTYVPAMALSSLDNSASHEHKEA